MAKRVTITMRDYVFEKYLRNYSGNKSAYMEEMFIRGIEAETSELSDVKTKYLEMLKQMKNLEEENQELKRKVGKYKEIHGGMDPETAKEEQLADQILDGFGLNNPLRHKL